MNDLKRAGGHGLALLLLLALLAIALTWFYRYFWNHYGSEAALVALVLFLTGTLILVIRGARHTYCIYRLLREYADAVDPSLLLNEKHRHLLFRVLDIDLNPHPKSVPELEKEHTRQEMQDLLRTPKKRRGKQARFPLIEIRAAVLEWEQRDPFFSAETLEEFLGRKFGYGADGVLLMAPSTFYDWRHRILRELQLEFGPLSHAEESLNPSLSEISSGKRAPKSYRSSESKP
ncbi:MAG: hypothetical protein HYZ25_15590 [Chloroflexi bacterium]|nr:hypothetical protein [Chloroflexota bacterium]